MIPAICLLLLPVRPAAADVYRWTDPAGGVHYADRPQPGALRIAQTLPAPPVYHRVSRVHDGDTVILEDGTRVRLLGINAPELDGPATSAEAGGDAAKLWLRARIEGHKVRLETDVEIQDAYHRTLAHLFGENGEHWNLALVRQGLAVAGIFPPNLKHADAITTAQAQAEHERLGIWADPAYAPRPIASLPQQHSRGWQRWYGTPAALDYDSSYARLIFTPQVDARIPKQALNLFPPLQSLLGKSLELRGWASRRKQHYSILLRHPSALAKPAQP